MLAFTHEQKIIGLVAALSLMVVAIVAGIVYPTITYINRVNQDTLNLRIYLEKRYENVKKMHNSREKVSEIKETVARYNQYLFYPGDELLLIIYLENLANSHQVEQKIDSTNLDKPDKRRIDIALTLTGNYQSLLRYLSELEASDYFFNVTQLHWSAAASGDGRLSQAQMRIQLSLYVDQQNIPV